MPPGHRPTSRPAADDTEPIELDSDLLVSETDASSSRRPPRRRRRGAAIIADELPAGLGWQLNRQWARVRPHARALAEATAAALSAFGKWTARAAAGALPLARRLWQHRLWQRGRQPLRRRWKHAAGGPWRLCARRGQSGGRRCGRRSAS